MGLYEGEGLGAEVGKVKMPVFRVGRGVGAPCGVFWFTLVFKPVPAFSDSDGEGLGAVVGNG